MNPAGALRQRPEGARRFVEALHEAEVRASSRSLRRALNILGVEAMTAAVAA